MEQSRTTTHNFTTKPENINTAALKTRRVEKLVRQFPDS